MSFLKFIEMVTLKKRREERRVERIRGKDERKKETYRAEVHVLEELLDEAAGGQAEHAMGQEVRHLRVQADVIKRVREFLFYPVGRAKDKPGMMVTLQVAAYSSNS